MFGFVLSTEVLQEKWEVPTAFVFHHVDPWGRKGGAVPWIHSTFAVFLPQCAAKAAQMLKRVSKPLMYVPPESQRWYPCTGLRRRRHCEGARSNCLWAPPSTVYIVKQFLQFLMNPSILSCSSSIRSDRFLISQNFVRYLLVSNLCGEMHLPAVATRYALAESFARKRASRIWWSPCKRWIRQGDLTRPMCCDMADVFIRWYRWYGTVKGLKEMFIDFPGSLSRWDAIDYAGWQEKRKAHRKIPLSPWEASLDDNKGHVRRVLLKKKGFGSKVKGHPMRAELTNYLRHIPFRCRSQRCVRFDYLSSQWAAVQAQELCGRT
jgi:hypothetical protein